MTAIKPPGGPGGIQGPKGPETSKATDAPSGPSFHERVSESKTTGPGAAAPAAGPPAVIAELRAGRITPNQAVHKLTDLAVDRSGASPAMRPAIEARMRDLMSRDPLIQDLVRQMGAQVPTSPDGEDE